MANKICWNWELVISFLRLQKECFFTFTLEIVRGPAVAYMLIFDIQLYMSKGPFDSLNIYCPYGSRISGFKNTTCNRPLLRYENFYKAQKIWCHNIWKNQIIKKSPQRDLNSIPTLHLSDTLLLYYGRIYYAFFLHCSSIAHIFLSAE